MNKVNKTAIAIALTLGVSAAYAHPGQMRGNMEHGAQQGQHQGMQGGMGHGQMQGMKQGATHGHGKNGSNAAQSLITPEERTAMQEKMRAATTPEERQQIASANRAEMQKRATEKGITLPEHRGPQGRGMGPNAGHQH
jgi:Spy/CpxP family protein refolding chaperone